MGQDKEDKEGKKTRGKNRTELGSVKLTSKSRNALFFVQRYCCLLPVPSPHPNTYSATPK
ncbi:hypothetical protein MC7420_1158 [Coleofasciculus chthonoplastes PCC 7420]|uniref:Uncharacterized protein n=1 Tax=Coleofasciculus chthonoplastes PCC 7420 TaxID=118168 RepID=B4VXI5_9CYAN|nr:hypothetical protein MC7420_1158 [Coleofasciculus chthonoplastes PCC 7420]